MARSHGKLLCAIWRDPEWVGLSARAQWLYMLLLSHQGLSLVGSLDVTPGKWATFAQGVTRDAVETALDELEDHRFVLVDHDTGELLIRSFTRHDIDPNRVNINLAKGLWGQWGTVASASLRSVALHEMSDAVWEKLEPHAPADAVQTRRSARLEPAPRIPVGDPEPVPGTQPPPSSLLPPVTNHPPAAAPPVVVDFDRYAAPKLDAEQRALNLAEIRAARDARAAVPHTREMR